MKMPSVMGPQHSFAQVPRAEIPRSQFDRSHGHKTTFDAGWLIPVYVDEALPGDTFNMRMSAFARLATPLKPLMDNLYLDSFFFAVPMRLVWDNFVKMMGEQANPGDSIDYLVPTMTAGVPSSGDLFDYMGLRPGSYGADGGLPSQLFARAYYLIWNEWFRDQNLQNSLSVPTDDTNRGFGSFALQRRGKRHDYFTSCLPFPQKGTAVMLPLGTSAPVVATGIPTFKMGASSVSSLYTDIGSTLGGNVRLTSVNPPIAAGQSVALDWQSPNLQTDLSSATAATINSLRQAFQVQKLLERDARGGTRYTELVKSHFGVTSPDARLQRPEYLGGGSAPLIISPIAQNSASNTQPTPQGNLAGIGTVSVRDHGFVKSFTEHTLLFGLVSVRADLTYQQGTERMWYRSSRYDFYWPALAHIGEQAVLNREIFTQATSTDVGVFGYQERYAEYRYKPSRLSGKFRSDVAGTLDIWHLSQDFASLPALNATFIVENPPIARVIAVPSEPHFLGDFWFSLKCARPIPVYSVPGLIDHF